MTNDMWEWDDVYRMMTEDAEQRRKRERKARERKHLMWLVVFCVALVLVFLVTVGPGDAAMGG